MGPQRRRVGTCPSFTFLCAPLTGLVELSPFRNPRYPLGKPYIKEYHKYFPVSEPEEDADDRLIMYLIRHQVCLAATAQIYKQMSSQVM